MRLRSARSLLPRSASAHGLTGEGVGKAVLKFSAVPRRAEGFQARQIQNTGGEAGSCQHWGCEGSASGPASSRGQATSLCTPVARGTHVFWFLMDPRQCCAGRGSVWVWLVLHGRALSGWRCCPAGAQRCWHAPGSRQEYISGERFVFIGKRFRGLQLLRYSRETAARSTERFPRATSPHVKSKALGLTGRFANSGGHGALRGVTN